MAETNRTHDRNEILSDEPGATGGPSTLAPMERRSFLLSSIAALLATMGLEGCGGGGGSAGAGSLQSTRGVVKIPAGSSLTNAQLAVGNSMGSKALAADGSFTARTDPNAPELVLVTHTNGRGVMFGFIDPASTTNVLDAQAQAVALIYLAIGGYGMPVTHKRDVLALIQQDAATAPLTAVIAQRIAADSFALEDADAQLAAAFQTAYNAIVAEGGGAKSASQIRNVQASHSAPAAISRASVIPLQLIIDQTGQQSGVEVVQDTSNTNITGVIATNYYRRRCQVLLYRVGDDSTGTRVNYPLAVLVGTPADLSSTDRLGLTTALTSLFGGSTPWAPVSTNTIPLTLVNGSMNTYYQIVVLGATNGTVPDPAFVNYAIYANELVNWTTIRSDLNNKTLLIDLFFGLALEMLGFGGVMPLDTQLSAAVAAINALEDVPVRTLLQQASSTGGIGVAAINLLQLAARSDIVGNDIRNKLALLLPTAAAQQALRESQGAPLFILSTMLKMLINILNVVQVVLGAGDVSKILYDLTVSRTAELWTATLSQPAVTVSPNPATIPFGGSQLFTAKVPTGVTGTILYDWSTTAVFGVLSDGGKNTGRTFETPVAAVTLTTAPSDTSPLTVSVTAIQVTANGSRNTIGTVNVPVTLYTPPTNGVTVTLTNLTADMNKTLVAAGTFTGLLGQLGVNFGNTGAALNVVSLEASGFSTIAWPLGGEVPAAISLTWFPATASGGASAPITEFGAPSGCQFSLANNLATPGNYYGASGTFTLLSLATSTAVVHIQAHMVGSGAGLTGDFEFDIDILGTVKYLAIGNVP